MRFLVVILVVGIASRAFAQPSVVQKTICQGSVAGSSTYTYNVSSGSLSVFCSNTLANITNLDGVIVNVSVSAAAPSVSSISDNLGCATWMLSPNTHINTSVAGDDEQWYSPYCPAGSLTLYITWAAGSGTNTTLDVREMNGAISFDSTNGNANKGSSTSSATNNITTANAHDYLLASLVKGIATAPSAGPIGGFNASQTQVTGTPYTWTSDQAVTSIGTYSSGYTFTHANWAMNIGAYEAAPSPTATATATATATGGATPTATATATATVTATCTATPTGGVPTATPTATATPAICVVPATVIYASPVPFATPTASITFTYGNAITFGDSLLLNAAIQTSAGGIQSVSDSINGNWHPDITNCNNLNNDIEDEIWRLPNSASASANTLLVTVTFNTQVAGSITFADAQGLTTTDQLGMCNQGSDVTLSTGVVTPGTTGDFIWGGIAQVGSNAYVSTAPNNPSFITAAMTDNPLNIPLYVPQNQFVTAQATVNVLGTPADYAGALVAYNVCSGQSGSGNAYIPPAF